MHLTWVFTPSGLCDPHMDEICFFHNTKPWRIIFFMAFSKTFFVTVFVLDKHLRASQLFSWGQIDSMEQETNKFLTTSVRTSIDECEIPNYKWKCASFSFVIHMTKHSAYLTTTQEGLARRFLHTRKRNGQGFCCITLLGAAERGWTWYLKQQCQCTWIVVHALNTWIIS